MFENIKNIIIDVDGTMTDGGIYYDQTGNEWKKFNARDAVGFWIAQALEIRTIVITGRESYAVMRRMQDLGVENVYQGIKNKKDLILSLMHKFEFSTSELGYIGDDLNDLPAMCCAAFKACPKDACTELLETADYISSANGGEGAVRDIFIYIAKQQGKWQIAMDYILNKFS